MSFINWSWFVFFKVRDIEQVVESFSQDTPFIPHQQLSDYSYVTINLFRLSSFKKETTFHELEQRWLPLNFVSRRRKIWPKLFSKVGRIPTNHCMTFIWTVLLRIAHNKSSRTDRLSEVQYHFNMLTVYQVIGLSFIHFKIYRHTF